MRATANSRTAISNENRTFVSKNLKNECFCLSFSFWSAVPLQLTELVPVLSLYALALFLSLQGTASPGAKWLKQYFIFKVAGCTHVVRKPDGSGSSRLHVGTTVDSRAAISDKNCPFISKKTNLFTLFTWQRINNKYP
ncbi:hypothetical protein ASU31_03835 [Pedobacter ginsenosidimutans]|uniref:Uncharacterized protein n=1 Tax=Pedobacter ginsenosidimutans TaxID=687842 RepID=A0A0T5VUX2_9SPHI|nr:hypothetical protein ASU31_03835 [Pedobacter ginsenosidimutans]